jgi:hypothetical protein
MNKCKTCGSKELVLDFVSLVSSENIREVVCDSFCFPCLVERVDNYFGEKSTEIFNDFHKIHTDKRKIGDDQHYAYYKVKDVMFEKLGDKLEASSFVFGVNHKTSIEEEEK